MKKRILKSTLAMAVVVAAGYVAYSSQTSTPMKSGIALRNVEALAGGEAPGETTHTLDCGASGLKMCEATCGRCNVTLRAWGNGRSARLTCNAR